MELRDYQRSGLETLQEAQNRGIRRNIIGLPTGGGKGTMIAFLAGRDVVARKNVLVLSPRSLITENLGERIRNAYDIYANLGRECTLMNVQKLLKMKRKPLADHVILDEVHRMRAAEWSRIFDFYPKSWITGFTATTDRADGKGLGDCFKNLIVPINYTGLVARRLLMPCDIYRPSEFLGTDLAISTVEACVQYARGPTIVYEHTKEAAFVTQAALRKLGLRSVVLVDSTPGIERTKAIKDFEARKLKFLINVMVLTEGVDIPCTETIVLGRGCGHATLFRQIVGRGMRPAKGKSRWLLIDLTGTSHNHDPPESDYHYELRTTAQERSGGGTRSEDEEDEEEDRKMPELPQVLGLELVDARSGRIILPNMPPTESEKSLRIQILKEEIEHGTKTARAAMGEYRYRFGESAPQGVFD